MQGGVAAGGGCPLGGSGPWHLGPHAGAGRWVRGTGGYSSLRCLLGSVHCPVLGVSSLPCFVPPPYRPKLPAFPRVVAGILRGAGELAPATMASTTSLKLPFPRLARAYAVHDKDRQDGNHRNPPPCTPLGQGPLPCPKNVHSGLGCKSESMVRRYTALRLSDVSGFVLDRPPGVGVGLPRFRG